MGSDGQRGQAMKGEERFVSSCPPRGMLPGCGSWWVARVRGWSWSCARVNCYYVRVDSVREGSSGRKEHLAFQKIWWKERPETR
jgi:hypothetical protein